jgi:hypothetical protein
MSDDAAVVRLGARRGRNLVDRRRNRKQLGEQAQKLRDATEAQVRNHRNFLRIDGPDELLEQPPDLLPGQEWGLWLFDDTLYEHLAVIAIRNGIVVAQTEDRQLLAIDQGHLRCRGHFLGWVR